MEGVRKAEITIPKTGPVPELLQGILPSFDWLKGVTLKVAIAHGTANARKVMDNIKAGGEFASYHFIEFMACRADVWEAAVSPTRPAQPFVQPAPKQSTTKTTPIRYASRMRIRL
jgi:hypothetical protein